MSAVSTARPSTRLTQNDLAHLTEAALEVILGHHVDRPSIDVELALWNALNTAHEKASRPPRWRLLAGGRTPSRQDVLATLAAAAFQVAVDSGVDPTDLLETELDLLFAFQSIDVTRTSSS